MKKIFFLSFFIVLLTACSGPEPTFVQGDDIKITDFGRGIPDQHYKGELIWFTQDRVVRKIVNGVVHDLLLVEIYGSDSACAFAVDQDVIIAKVGSFESVNGVILKVKQLETAEGNTRALVEIGQPLLVGYE